MKAFFFLGVAPVACAIITTHLGIGLFQEGQGLNWALINIPVCLFSAVVHMATE